MNDWSELFPDDFGPLGIDVRGDEHENPNQPRRPVRYVAQRPSMSAAEWIERYNSDPDFAAAARATAAAFYKAGA